MYEGRKKKRKDGKDGKGFEGGRRGRDQRIQSDQEQQGFQAFRLPTGGARLWSGEGRVRAKAFSYSDYSDYS